MIKNQNGGESMLLIRPCHTPEFLTANHLGVEAHITRYDRLPDWPQYVPFVYGVHLSTHDKTREIHSLLITTWYIDAVVLPID